MNIRIPRSVTFSQLFTFILGSQIMAADPMSSQSQTGSEGGSTVVEKTVEDFSGTPWIPSPYNLASGVISTEREGAKGKRLKVDVNFSGQGGFEHFTVTPTEPIYIPGDAKKITFRVKRSDPRFGVRMSFVDGWGPRDSSKLVWDPKLKGTDWQTVSFDIPPEWIRPVAISGINTHNFAARSEKMTFTFSLADLVVETNTSAVDPDTGMLKGWEPDPNPADEAKVLKAVPLTPLIDVSLSTPEQGNVFSEAPPRVILQVRNWTPGELTGEAKFDVVDDAGNKSTFRQSLSVSSSSAFELPVEATRFGLYTVRAKVVLNGHAPLERELRIAKVPALQEPTEAKKIASPYGLNYHGGGTRLFAAFKKAGLYWYRDYAFRLETMRKAKGADRRYAGWPFYPAIMNDYEKLGLIVLPILDAIEPPEIKDGKIVKIAPDRKWIDDVADILVTFPQVRFWELANEYDLNPVHMAGERAINWWNYYNYHQKFAELVDLLGDGEVTAVENGRSGIYPVFTEHAVSSGSFDKIGVVNCHHYTGTEPPEINFENFNQGDRMVEGRSAGSFFDSLRETKRAALADGRQRQAWLTEFGWDTLAGPVVSPEQQAAYLQRGFLLSFAAGIDKGFWFYNFDAEKGVRFFDGCGLLAHDRQPKLSFSAMAGLSSLLPNPVYVGSINAGPNTWGYVFENDGKLVAGLWTVEGDAPGSAVNFAAGQLFDYFGNPLPGRSAKLGLAPVYAVGLEKGDPLYLQTAYEIWSNHMIIAAAGDPAETILEITNNREGPLTAQIRTTVPQGWTTTLPETSATVAPGETEQVKIPFVVSPESKQGMEKVSFDFLESGTTVKTMAVTVYLQDPFALEVAPLEGEPGATKITVNIQNRSAVTQSGRLAVKLPASWTASEGEVSVADLQPGETRPVSMQIDWSRDWKEGESALAVFTSSSGVTARAPIIPNQFHLTRAPELKMDGSLSDWPTAAEIPAWMLGATRGNPEARLWLAWSPEGLYGAVEVRDSKAQGKDPKFFWSGDVLELFLSTKETEASDSFELGDHQFWFVPQTDEKRVFVGQWKVKEEIDATRYDVPGVRSFSQRTKDGYVMEFFLPAAAFQEFKLAAGRTIRLNANLTVRGAMRDREVYWPRKKGADVNTRPANWGRVRLVP